MPQYNLRVPEEDTHAYSAQSSHAESRRKNGGRLVYIILVASIMALAAVQCKRMFSLPGSGLPKTPGVPVKACPSPSFVARTRQTVYLLAPLHDDHKKIIEFRRRLLGRIPGKALPHLLKPRGPKPPMPAPDAKKAPDGWQWAKALGTPNRGRWRPKIKGTQRRNEALQNKKRGACPGGKVRTENVPAQKLRGGWPICTRPRPSGTRTAAG